MMSLPYPPLSTLAAALPVIVSLPEPPVAFTMPVKVSVMLVPDALDVVRLIVTSADTEP